MTHAVLVIRLILLSFFFLPISCLQAQEENCANEKGKCSEITTCCSKQNFHALPYRLYFQEVIGRGIGYSTGYATLGGFLSFSPSSYPITPFIDARIHRFNHGKWATNIGLGNRFLSRDLDAIIGWNIFYDTRRMHHTLHQMGVGFEILRCQYDIRVNGYLPVGNKMDCGHRHSYFYPGGFLAKCQECRNVLAGYDVEVGRSLFGKSSCKFLDLYAALGVYYYHQKHDDSIRGGKIRLATHALKYLTLEVQASYDSVYYTSVQGCLSATLAFGCNGIVVGQSQLQECNSSLEAKMRQPLYRQEIIVRGKRHCKWWANF